MLNNQQSCHTYIHTYILPCPLPRGIEDWAAGVEAMWKESFRPLSAAVLLLFSSPLHTYIHTYIHTLIQISIRTVYTCIHTYIILVSALPIGASSSFLVELLKVSITSAAALMSSKRDPIKLYKKLSQKNMYVCMYVGIYVLYVNYTKSFVRRICMYVCVCMYCM